MGGGGRRRLGWNDVLPFFRKLETDKDFGGGMHGSDGPVPIWRLPKERWPPISTALQSFADERQIPRRRHERGFRDGYAVGPISNWPDNKRRPAAICYLTPDVRARSNLTIISGATVTDIAFDGRRATGVSATIGGETKAFTGREIIVSLGGIHSPAMLMRSGIGPSAHLREHGIAVRADMPGVGANLSNHSLLFIGISPEARGAARRRCGRTRQRCCASRPVCPAARRPTCTSMCRAGPRSALGTRIANLAPSLWKPMGRGRVALRGRIAGRSRWSR